MHEEPTTVIIQRYLDGLPGDPAASTASGLSPDGRRMLGVNEGLPKDEREV
jgi:hypothetical protein